MAVGVASERHARDGVPESGALDRQGRVSLGSAHHPDWYFNLAKDPDDVWVETDHRRLNVRAEALTGLERDEAWRRIVAAAPRFGADVQQADRVIPIARRRFGDVELADTANRVEVLESERAHRTHLPLPTAALARRDLTKPQKGSPSACGAGAIHILAL